MKQKIFWQYRHMVLGNQGRFVSYIHGSTLVWCRGRSRNVEGCWGFPHLKIDFFVGFTKFPFHIVDRSEINIHDLGDFI